MRRIMIAAMLALVGAGSATAAGESAQRLSDSTLPLENVITKPDWAELPSADDMARYYPDLATQLELEGRATITCTVNAAGRLQQCEVRSEVPLGMGFGKAALGMASAFRMKPLTVDGTPVDGGQVSVPIRFRVPADDPVEAPPAVQPTSPEAMALARQIQELNGAKASMQRYSERYQQALSQYYASDPAGSPEEAAARQAALDALRESQAAAWDKMLDRRAASMTELPKAQLEAIVAFLQSPAGKAYTTEQLAQANQESADQKALTRLSRSDARARFCAKVKCETLPPVDNPPPPGLKAAPSASAPKPH